LWLGQPDALAKCPEDRNSPMLENDPALAAMAEALAKSADYRVLRRLVPREIFTSSIGQNTKTGILLDVETTGLNQQKDEIIELGMVKFDYLPDGRIASLRDVYTSFNEPSEPIPLEVTALTGITDDMVAGQRIDDSAVFSFVDDAVIVIAHNASFDRKFVERYWSIFQRKAWGCSATEVEWRKHGFEGSRLGYLLNGAGFFHQAHRAVDDCHALLEILACELPTTGTSALAVLLERARKKTMRVWAEQSPFDLKDSLKRRGYRWSDGSDGRPRSWYIDVDESKLDDEIAFLKTEIYLRDMGPRLQTLTAFDRFSVRA
jgi:DNA polymerase III subunit epsilon